MAKETRAYHMAHAVVFSTLEVSLSRFPMNREEALHISTFSATPKRSSRLTKLTRRSRIAADIKTATKDDFPLLLPVMGGAAVFTGMLLPHLDFPMEFDTST